MRPGAGWSPTIVTHDLPGVLRALEHHGDDRAAAHERDEVVVERPCRRAPRSAGPSVSLSSVRWSRATMRRPLASNRAEDRPDQPALDGVGLEQDQGPIRHGRRHPTGRESGRHSRQSPIWAPFPPRAVRDGARWVPVPFRESRDTHMGMELAPLDLFARDHHGLVTRRAAMRARWSERTWYRAVETGQLELIHPEGCADVRRRDDTEPGDLRRRARRRARCDRLASLSSLAVGHPRAEPTDPVDVLLPWRTRRARASGRRGDPPTP